MSQIQHHFQVNLPLATLFQHPTIEALAQHLEQPTESSTWSSLVPIQTQGHQLPLFCVPGMGGNVLYFYELSRSLGVEQPLYGLQAQGLDGRSQPHRRIEEMAAHYIEEIRTVQPEGPYCLAGHSFGGRVVFEMARQLLAQGQTIAFLGILDTIAPLPNQPRSDRSTWTEIQLLVAIAESVQNFLGLEMGLSEETLHPLSAREQFKQLQGYLIQAGVLSNSDSEAQLQGLLQVFNASILSYWDYEVDEPLPLPITLFRAAERPEDTESAAPLLDDPTYGWEGLSTFPVEVQVVPGTHQTMMAQPQVQVLAQAIEIALQNQEFPVF